MEFLHFDLVTVVKSVSKTTREAVRRAVVRGRWRPIRYVAVEGLAVTASVGANKHVFIGTFGGSDPPPAAPSAIFREAWALDPALVIRVICCDWDITRVGAHPAQFRGAYEAVFLWIVEPSMDGLPRIVSACEDTFSKRSAVMPGPFFPFPMLRAWREVILGHLLLDTPFFSNETRPLIGTGLEAWADALLAAEFTRALFDFSGSLADDVYMYDIVAQVWSDEWQDRAKAGVFLAEMGRIREEVSERVAAELYENQDSYSYQVGDY